MKITREEELLLEGFNKNVSTKSSALFYGNAFIVSAIPVWLYWRVHSVDMSAYAIMFVIGKYNLKQFVGRFVKRRDSNGVDAKNAQKFETFIIIFLTLYLLLS